MWKSVWIKGRAQPHYSDKPSAVLSWNPYDSIPQPFKGSARKNTRQPARWEKPSAIISAQTRVTSQLVWLVLQRRRIFKKEKKKRKKKETVCRSCFCIQTWTDTFRTEMQKKNKNSNGDKNAADAGALSKIIPAFWLFNTWRWIHSLDSLMWHFKMEYETATWVQTVLNALGEFSSNI